MFDTTTKTYTNRNGAGSFAWMVEGNIERTGELDHDTASTWADEVISQSIEHDIVEMRERAESIEFPIFSYTTNPDEMYTDYDDYVTRKTEEITEEISAEKDAIIEFLLAWDKGSDA